MNTIRPTQALRDEHASLLPHIEALADAARRIPAMDEGERVTAIREARDFLEGHLMPHAQAEEATLYPAWSDLVGYPDAAATMIREHEAIVQRITALGTTPADDTGSLQAILFGLHALIVTHFGIEESLVLDAFDANPAAAQHVMQALAR